MTLIDSLLGHVDDLRSEGVFWVKIASEDWMANLDTVWNDRRVDLTTDASIIQGGVVALLPAHGIWIQTTRELPQGTAEFSVGTSSGAYGGARLVQRQLFSSETKQKPRAQRTLADILKADL